MNGSDSLFGRVLLGIDLQPASAELVRLALACPGVENEHLVLCVIVAEDASADAVKETVANLGRFRDRWAPGASIVVRSGNVALELLRAAEECGAELLIVGRRHRSLQHSLYRGRTIGELVAATTIPLLILPMSPEDA